MRQTDREPGRTQRLLAVAVGAVAVLVLCGVATTALFAAWARSWSTEPSSTCVEFGCVQAGDFRELATLLFGVAVVIGIGFGLAVVAVTVAVLAGATSWRPRAGSGALVAVGLGTLAAAAGMCLGVPVLVLLALLG